MCVFRWLLVWQWLWLSLPLTSAGAQQYLPLQPNKVRLAQKYYREGIARHDTVRIAEGYYEYGKLYAAATDYLTATRWFIRAMHLIEPRGDSYELARLHVRLADLAEHQADYPRMRQHAHTALAIATRCQSERGTIRACALLARLHDRDWQSDAPAAMNWPVANPDSGLHYFRRVEKLAYRLNDPMEVAHVKQDIGNQLIRRNDPRALTYLETALRIAIGQNSTDRLGMMLSVASAHLHTNRPDRAWVYIDRARQLANREYPNVRVWQFNVTSMLVQYYRATGNWKHALVHADQLHQWEKRDLMADHSGAISRLNVEYETEKKESTLKTQRDELALRDQNLLIQQRFLWTMASFLLLTVAMSVIFFRLYRKNQRISLQNAELVNEQNHRVKNNLQVVSSLLNLQASRLIDIGARQAVAESQLRVQAMATLHRRLYDGPQLARVNVAEFMADLVDEVLATFGYAHLQPNYDLNSIYLSADHALPLGLIMTELTTNVCKYSFPDHPDPAFWVSCHRQPSRPNTLVLRVADNGPGLPEAPINSAKPPTTFGMRLIAMQARQLRATYNFTSDHGTLFTLHLDY